MSIREWIIWLAAFAGIFFAGHYIRRHPEQFATASHVAAPQTAAPQSDPTTDAIRALKIKQFSITKTGRGNTGAIGAFTFENRGSRNVKDVQLRCNHAGENGAIIANSSPTISEVFQAHSVRIIQNVNMGVIRSKIEQSDCEVIGLSLVSPSATTR